MMEAISSGRLVDTFTFVLYDSYKIEITSINIDKVIVRCRNDRRNVIGAGGLRKK